MSVLAFVHTALNLKWNIPGFKERLQAKLNWLIFV